MKVAMFSYFDLQRLEDAINEFISQNIEIVFIKQSVSPSIAGSLLWFSKDVSLYWTSIYYKEVKQ